MAHQPGWIELYSVLECDQKPEENLVELCLSSRSGIGETMLHWYSIEGEDTILQKIIDLGFEVNVQNDFGATPIMEAAYISRWDNVKVLLLNGADLNIKNESDEDFFDYLNEAEITIPSDIQNLIKTMH